MEFRSNNTAHRPVIEALELIVRYATAGNLTYYPLGEHVPAHRGAAGDWADLVYRADTRGRQRVIRMVYEVATFQALREQLRCKEIWVVGARRRGAIPTRICPPTSSSGAPSTTASSANRWTRRRSSTTLRERDDRRPRRAQRRVPALDWLEITDRASGRDQADTAATPRRSHGTCAASRQGAAPWGTVAADRHAQGNGAADRLPGRRHRRRRQRHAAGRGAGRAAAARDLRLRHQHRDQRRGRRRARPQRGRTSATPRAATSRRGGPRRRDRASPTPPSPPASTTIWGEGTTAVASDSTHFRSYDQNMFTEWHSRYGGRGVLIYWHVEKKSMVVHSQLLQLLGVRGARDGRGRHPARHHHDGRGQLRRHPRPVRDRVRHHPAARLRPAPADQTDQQGEALPARRPASRTPTRG